MTGLLIRFLRDLRLVPIVLIATIALFALKALGLVLDGGYLFDSLADGRGGKDGNDSMEITGTVAAPRLAGSPAKQSPAAAKQSWAQQMFNYPGVTGSVGSTPPNPNPRLHAGEGREGDITGAVAAPPSPPKEETPRGEAPVMKPQEPPSTPNGTAVPLDLERPVSQAERAILESLQKRRTELDARAHELDVREDLLRAAEKRVGGRIDELKDLEARVDAAMQKKDEGELARFKNVVAMYENMKAKDAAKIFDGLDIKVLLDVTKEINPRRMSDILAQMAPENAQRLTVELAMRSAQRDQSQAADLPKIEGRPNPN
jgi:flagellar motility protein MotE (MotC chaperone)